MKDERVNAMASCDKTDCAASRDAPAPKGDSAGADRARESPGPKRLTFVLPGRGRSGGVRVTVEMGNRLLERGYAVRIAYRRAALVSPRGVRRAAKDLLLRLQGHAHSDWLREFRGESVGFARLSDVPFREGEVVVAVGTMTIHDVAELSANVVKVRYCHGIPENLPDPTRSAYRIPMATIAVSRTLASQLAELTGGPPVRIVPNGVDTAQYYADSFPRDGVGLIYSSHYLKAPEVALAILRRLRERRPGLPLYVFGEEPRPRGLARGTYWRLPPVEKARELYSRSKVWVLPSRSEGLPGPVLEAMACGCAVVSSMQAGSLEIIRNGENGLLVPVGDVEGFLHSIEGLLDDESRRRSIAAEGLQTVTRFSWPNAVSRMEEFLEDIRRGRGASPGGVGEDAAASGGRQSA
jgi:hypothetical protein